MASQSQDAVDPALQAIRTIASSFGGQAQRQLDVELQRLQSRSRNRSQLLSEMLVIAETRFALHRDDLLREIEDPKTYVMTTNAVQYLEDSGEYAEEALSEKGVLSPEYRQELINIFSLSLSHSLRPPYDVLRGLANRQNVQEKFPIDYDHAALKRKASSDLIEAPADKQVKQSTPDKVLMDNHGRYYTTDTPWWPWLKKLPKRTPGPGTEGEPFKAQLRKWKWWDRGTSGVPVWTALPTSVSAPPKPPAAQEEWLWWWNGPVGWDAETGRWLEACEELIVVQE